MAYVFALRVPVQVTQPAGANMFVGEKVYIEGNGEGARRAAGELIACSVIPGK